jgi:para-nitrobenzyl esterase
VRDHIRAFGGDPDRITVFGESAGGGSVAALLAMPIASGLFRRAVAQSAQGTFFSRELAADIASTCAAELGLQPTMGDLATVDPALLAAAGDSLAAGMAERVDRWGPAAHRSIPFSPVIDADTLPVTPWQALAAGAGREIDLLVGHTRDEHRLFSALDGQLGRVTAEEAETALRILAPEPDGARRYRDAYPTAGHGELHELVNSDWAFRMPTLHLAEGQTAAGGRVHAFELTWQAPGMGGILGACHGLDVPLVFGNLDRGLPALLIGEGPNAEAEEVSARMRAAWTAFASRGDPGWGAYDAEERLVQLLDARSTIAADPERASRLIWADHAFAALGLVDS